MNRPSRDVNGKTYSLFSDANTVDGSTLDLIASLENSKALSIVLSAMFALVVCLGIIMVSFSF